MDFILILSRFCLKQNFSKIVSKVHLSALKADKIANICLLQHPDQTTCGILIRVLLILSLDFYECLPIQQLHALHSNISFFNIL